MSDDVSKSTLMKFHTSISCFGDFFFLYIKLLLSYSKFLFERIKMLI